MVDKAHDEARAALLKFTAVALAIAVVVGLGTLFAVKSLGIGGGGSSGGAATPSTATSSPRSLPTVAITPSGSAAPSVSADPSQEPSATPTPTTGITLTASPSQVAPGERINLTGTYTGSVAGGGGPILQVQRQSGRAWGQFGTGAGVSARVTGGSFATYVVTTRTGPSKFRLVDPATGTASNVVRVTVG